MNDEVHYAIGMKIADADGSDFTFPVQLFHRPPRAADISVRLMDQIQIWNFLSNLTAGLIAYTWKEKKPSLNLNFKSTVPAIVL